jgi:hypothetical protein
VRTQQRETYSRHAASKWGGFAPDRASLESRPIRPTAQYARVAIEPPTTRLREAKAGQVRTTRQPTHFCADAHKQARQQNTRGEREDTTSAENRQSTESV